MAIRKAQYSHWHPEVILAAIVAVLGTLAAFLLYSGEAREKQSLLMGRGLSETARLISIDSAAGRWTGRCASGCPPAPARPW